jgi:Na+/H+-dicarboxylate symporter
MQCIKNQHFAQRLKPVFSIHAPLVSPLCVAIGAPLESLAHLMIADTVADAFRTVANITEISLHYLIVCDHCPSLATASRPAA